VETTDTKFLVYSYPIHYTTKNNTLHATTINMLPIQLSGVCAFFTYQWKRQCEIEKTSTKLSWNFGKCTQSMFIDDLINSMAQHAAKEPHLFGSMHSCIVTNDSFNNVTSNNERHTGIHYRSAPCIKHNMQWNVGVEM